MITKKRIIAIIALFMIIFQTTSPVVYAMEKEVINEVLQDEELIEVNFVDKRLKNYLLNDNDLNSDGKLTIDEMAQIKTISIFSSITTNEERINLSGLEYATSLQEFETFVGCTNYSVLSKLEKLEKLDVINYNLGTSEDYNAVTKIPNLKIVELTGEDFNTVNLYDLPKSLEELKLSGCNLERIDDNIERFSNLSSLLICGKMSDSDIEIKGLEKINKLQKLKTLNLMSLGLKDINFLINNTTIENLNIYSNEIEEISVISTLTNLKSLHIASNKLADLSVIEQLPDTITIENASQIINTTAQITKGSNLELELPQIIKDALAPNYKFYVTDSYFDNEYTDKNLEISLNNDKSKMILYTGNLNAGKYTETIRLWGDGALSGTTWNIRYTVIQEADDNIEVTFEDEELKTFFQDNYDLNNDGKITQYEMAQITSLSLNWVEKETSLQPLQYCISLEELQLSGNYIDFAILQELDELKILSFEWYSNKVNEYEEITKLEKLKSLEITGSNEAICIDKFPKTITKLTLSNCIVEDISIITDFVNLTVLKLSCIEINGIKGLEYINKIPKLNDLNLWSTNITDISFLKDNETIENLEIAINKIKDITVINTMKNLKYIEIMGNQIEDITVLENTELLNNIYNLNQSFEYNDIVILQGEKLEIETSPTIRSAFDIDSAFYLKNLKTSVTKGEEQNEAKLTEDGTKIIIDTTQMEIGEYNQTINISGIGFLDGTTIHLNYTVAKQADDTKEVEFGSEKIKNYIQNNYDANGDEKITEYDMAQITKLELPSYAIQDANNENLQGLEFCVSLKELYIEIPATNYNVIKDISTIEKIKANLSYNCVDDFNAIINLENLKAVSIENANFTAINLFALPTQIEELEIGYSEIIDIQQITQFSNLKSLIIKNSHGIQPIQGLQLINELENLTKLTLEAIGLQEISFLNNNDTIEELYLGNNYIKDITPITTMTKLKNVSFWENQIENISVLKDMPVLIENSNGWSQSFRINDIYVVVNNKIEIELPDTVKQCFDENSVFYIEEAQVLSYNGSSKVSLNSDRTKLIIDATNEKIGQKEECLSIEGNGKLSGTSIYITYKVIDDADNTIPIEFGNKELEQYILNNYDDGGDGKITAFDMAQIEDLNINHISIENLKGLEYAKNLKSLSINVKYENYNEDIQYDFSQLLKLTNLKRLYIMGEAYKIDILSNLTNLEHITIQLGSKNEQIQSQVKQIIQLTNLQGLTLYAYKNYQENIKIDYSFLQKLTKLKLIYIEDDNDNSIDAQIFTNMSELSSLAIISIELTNIEVLSNLPNLMTIQLDACKIENIDFIKKLTNLGLIYMPNNFITDISPLEELNNVSYMDFTNNPIGEIDAKYVKILEHIKNNRLWLTDYSLTENLTFENEELKKQLINNSYDVNRDGELSKYEISKVEHLYPNYCLENAQYFTNLKYLGISYINLTTEELAKFIEQINLLNENVQISISSLTINLGNIEPEQTCTELEIVKEMQNPNSRIYMEGLTFTEQYDYQNAAEIKDGKIYFSEDYAGDAYYMANISNGTSNVNLTLNWKKIVIGDDTKEIFIEDPILKQELLTNHDIDSDKKITENDMLNISILDIAGKGITSLKGLEYAKNMAELYAEGNKIKDISPLVEIGRAGWYYLADNEITDITCIANSKLDVPLDLGIMDNYIDFLGDNKNLEVLKANYEKTYSNTDSTLDYWICSQRYGKPEDADKEVTLDSKIKQKLIEAGVDENDDNKFTRRELYHANEYIYEIDLSGLGLTNVNGLEYLAIGEINLSNNQLTDITPLGKNKGIYNINLSSNKIKDISCFANYNNFFWGRFDFSNNQIEDISSIKTWPVMTNTGAGDWQSGGVIGRDINIDLSNNNIKDISVVKDFRHIYKLNLTNNQISNIEPLAQFNFVCFEDEDEKVELLEDFEGIFLDGNYINTQVAGNIKAINVFKNKNVKLKIDNQKQFDVSIVFRDVKKTDWYYTAVQYNYNNMMIRGLNDTTFAPNQTLTRAMLVTILHRMEGMPYVPGLSKFSDVQNTSAYYYVAVKWATQKGIVSGYNNGKFGPDDPITREQLAVILNNYCRYKGKYKTVNVDLSKYKDSSEISDYAKWGMNWAVGSGVITGNATEKTLNPQGTATRAEAASMLYKYCLNIK